MEFDAQGVLLPGDYEFSISALRQSVLVTGVARGSAHWDAAWRSHLVDNLSILCGHLWSVGIDAVYADGSFCTDKDRPGDIDGYYVCDFEEFLRDQFPRLAGFDPAWDLTKRSPDQSGKPKPLMWHSYRVELFPMFRPPLDFLSRAAQDPLGQPILFGEFFRRARSGGKRGIVRILQESRS